MSFRFINNFQNHLYKILLDNEEINQIIKDIYIGEVQDGKTPFLIIKIDNAVNLSHHLESIYNVEFQILAYAKDDNYQILVKLADYIVSTLEEYKNANFNGYIISGIKANNLNFDRAKDLVLNKLSISYKALIKEEEYNELS